MAFEQNLPVSAVSQLSGFHIQLFGRISILQRSSWWFLQVSHLTYLVFLAFKGFQFISSQFPSFRTHNRGQNSLGHMRSALKEAFPVCKLLPLTANAPLPPAAMLVDGRGHIFNSSMTFSSAFNIAMGGWGISTRNFPQNTKGVLSFVRDCSYLAVFPVSLAIWETEFPAFKTFLEKTGKMGKP